MYFDRCDNERPIKESECSIDWKTEQIKKSRNKRKEGTSKPSQKKPILWIIEPKKVEQQVALPIQILMQKYHIGLKQAVVKRNRLECIS